MLPTQSNGPFEIPGCYPTLTFLSGSKKFLCRALLPYSQFGALLWEWVNTVVMTQSAVKTKHDTMPYI